MHLLHYPLPAASPPNPSYCFLPLPCGTFHLWLLSFLFCLTVDYATGEPLFQISTKYSISSNNTSGLFFFNLISYLFTYFSPRCDKIYCLHRKSSKSNL